MKASVPKPKTKVDYSGKNGNSVKTGNKAPKKPKK
jgi:hypothetical protein